MSTLKDIIIGDNEKNYELTSAEELLGERRNNWKGWRCSAGVDNVHITPDGNIFAATCRVGGLLGNVFDHGVMLPKVWALCDKEWCMCGSDMKLPKTKDSMEVKLTQELFQKEVQKIEQPSIIGNTYYHGLRDFPKNVTWDLGRRCNFSCSYCPPSTSNNFEAHKSWGTLKYAADFLLKEFCGDKRAKWVFTGGEPTINPSYMDLVKYLVSKYQIIHTQTNGSRTPEYFSELIQYSSIGISVHLEESTIDRIAKNVEAMVFQKVTDKKASYHWIGIRIMVPPTFMQKALDLDEALRKINGYGKLFTVNMSPVYKKENGDELMDYEQDELQKITAYV